MTEMKIKVVKTLAVVLAIGALIGFATASGSNRNVAQKSSESSVTTNENGAVTRTYTEMTVSTNGNMVTERRRETHTTQDADGNVLATTTSEYSQRYSVGDESLLPAPTESAANAESANDTFMGLEFGDTFPATNFVQDTSEPTMLRASFVPQKKLAGFDDYYVFVTPKTHQVAKIYACAKDAIDPDSSWKNNYLIEALEKRYNTWARLRSWCRPVFLFNIGSGRYVSACLFGASRQYETIITAWDSDLLTTAADETEELRADALKAAAERRRTRVDDAADAF